MGWRFRKSIKMGPGVRLNLGDKSWGISSGIRGFRISSNSRSGTHLNAGIPGTGLSYRQKLGSAPGSGNTPAGSDAAAGCLMIWALLSPGSCGCVGLVLLVAAVLFLGWITKVVVTALSIVLAILTGLAPLLMATIAVAFIVRTTVVVQDKKKAVASGVLAGGLLLNVMFLAIAPQFYPPAAIGHIMGRWDASGATDSQTPASTEAGEAENQITPNPTSSPKTSSIPRPTARPFATTPQAVQPKLQILRSSFRIERLRNQSLSSAMSLEGRLVSVAEDMKRDMRVIAWTLQLKNPGTQDIALVSYVPVFQDADGTPVDRDMGLADKASRDYRYGCNLVSLEKISLRLKAGEERTMILRELASRQASDRIKSAQITIQTTAKIQQRQ